MRTSESAGWVLVIAVSVNCMQVKCSASNIKIVFILGCCLFNYYIGVSVLHAPLEKTVGRPASSSYIRVHQFAKLDDELLKVLRFFVFACVLFNMHRWYCVVSILRITYIKSLLHSFAHNFYVLKFSFSHFDRWIHIPFSFYPFIAFNLIFRFCTCRMMLFWSILAIWPNEFVLGARVNSFFIFFLFFRLVHYGWVGWWLNSLLTSMPMCHTIIMPLRMVLIAKVNDSYWISILYFQSWFSCKKFL